MKPLEGVKVIELSTMLAGPMTARILAEWGAEVIKVESMNGDPWRKQGPTAMCPTTDVANPIFDMENLNKKFISINMRTDEGKQVMAKLLEKADVFLTNYRVQALEGMGLAYEQIKDKYPRLIHASVLGYGDKGPEHNRPGYDYSVFYARSGIMADLASAGGPPLVPMAGIGDHSVAVALAGGIAAALYKRTVTGKGDKVDVSLLQMAIFISATGILNGFYGRKLPRDRYDCSHACSNSYKGSDGEWLFLAVIDYRRFPEFCEAIGMPEIAKDPRFSTQPEYYKNRAELTHILEKRFAEKPVAYWHKLLDDHDLPHELVHHFKDIPNDPQALANRYVYPYEYTDGTKTVFVNGPVHFESVNPESIPTKLAGKLGENTKAVLKDLGYSDNEISSLYEKKAIQ
jgi:crotonobetainyl-CoA:carnitine CoA-transferase CaiB-like acyl-CoA transferase